ncbi:MAG: ECF transporter S component [Ruminococcaceae bacterium]|nr:ECF transporter S component [Oscillospiraceae bacterium]
MKKQSLYSLAGAAVFAALICVATILITIPMPATGGYINLGDGFALLAGWLLGPLYGFAAAGIGSALADLLLGYAAYVPGTFVIKGLIALLAALLCGVLKKNCFSVILASAIAEAEMVLGYFLYESLILGYGMAASASVVGNLIQAIGGIIVFTVFSGVLRSVKGIADKRRNKS